MRIPVSAIPYWAVFGLGLSAGLVLLAATFVRLSEAFGARALTRGVLVDVLVLIVAALALFLAAGWGFASRPRLRPRRQFEGFTYH